MPLMMKERIDWFTLERTTTLSVAMAFTLIAIAIALVFFVPEYDESSLGTYETPQRVEGLVDTDGRKLVPLGGEIVVFGKRCINTEQIEVLAFRTFTRTDISPPTTVQGATRKIEPREQDGGCMPTTLEIPMPAEVTVGVWRIDGIDLSTSDGAIRIWTSEEFRVTNRP